MDINNNSIHDKFIEQIWKRLNTLGWRPMDLARASGLSQATISRIMHGHQKNYTENTKRKIEIALQIKLPRFNKLDTQIYLDELIDSLKQQIELLKHQNERFEQENRELRLELGVLKKTK